MHSAVKPLLLAAAAIGALCAASSASAQSYGYGRSYAPPPPPPPAPGQVFERDDGYVDGFASIPNSDSTYGLRNYTSRPDTTPDDPSGYAYRADKDRRLGGYGYGRYDDDGYGAPPPRYAGRSYAPQGYGYGDGYGYSEPRSAPSPRYSDRYDDEDAPPAPRYAQPGYGASYPAYGPSRGW